MKTFIQKYICFEGSSNLVGSTPVDLQVALYVQGTKYHNSQTRRQGLPSLVQAKEVVGGIARDERAVQYEMELAAKFAQVKKLNTRAAQQVAMAAKKFEQAVFLENHNGLPKIFGHNEIHLLNLARPADDQLELLEGGLLKNHCCFPKCPMYLVNLATDKDKVLGRRTGLRKHLKLLFYPSNYYIPHFHLVANSIVRYQPTISLDAFRQKMEADTDWHRSAYTNERKNELIEEVYKTLHAFYAQKY